MIGGAGLVACIKDMSHTRRSVLCARHRAQSYIPKLERVQRRATSNMDPNSGGKLQFQRMPVHASQSTPYDISSPPRRHQGP